MAKHTLPFDELNAFQDYTVNLLGAKNEGKISQEAAEIDIIDELLDLYLLAYENGAKYASEALDENISVKEKNLENAIFKRFKGKDFVDRIKRYARDGTIKEIMRVADTDMHRIYNTGVLDTASESERIVYKQWNTMLDDKVRDTHSYLEGMTIPITEAFFTYDGDSAMIPGDFTLPSNNANCRCVIDIIPQ